MSLSVGIVGLPNVGKSTLFNALRQAQGKLVSGLAQTGNYPFTTIEPNVGVVAVLDERLEKLAWVVAGKDSIAALQNDESKEWLSHLPPEVPAMVNFIDIAGLIAGAHKGEGLGNKFLAHIREVKVVCHVVRAFSDADVVKEGSVNPKSDFETVETELKLADLQTLEKQKDPGGTPDKELRKRWEVVKKLKVALEKGIPARGVELDEAEQKAGRELSLLTAKSILVVINGDEDELKKAEELEKEWAEKLRLDKEQVVVICAKTEAELADLNDEEQKEYLQDLGVEKSGLERLIKKAFTTLGLMTFLTAGEIEVRAWTIKQGDTALVASGVIHTDFMEKFIKAKVCRFEDFVNLGGWQKASEAGKVRMEGRDYVMQEGDVVEFMIGK